MHRPWSLVDWGSKKIRWNYGRRDAFQVHIGASNRELIGAAGYSSLHWSGHLYQKEERFESLFTE